MSCMYYRVLVDPEPVEVYGFKKVSAKQLCEITERVSKPTYSRSLATEDQTHVYNYRYLRSNVQNKRTPNVQCSKSKVNSETQCNIHKRRYTDREIHRVVRRLCKPTLSFEAQTTNYRTTKPEIAHQRESTHPQSKMKEHKRCLRLSRPTTASLAKTLDVCHLCYDHENKRSSDPLDAFDYSYDDEKVVSAEEVDFIVERLCTPTLASRKGSAKCRKTPIAIDEVKIRQGLPLLSGLSRSKTLDEITTRLHNRSRLGMTPYSTTIVAY